MLNNSDNKNKLFTEIADEFLFYCQYEKPEAITRQTLISYKASIKRIIEIIGNKNILEINDKDALEIRRSLQDRKCTPGYIARIMSVLKVVLKFCQDERGMEVFSPESIQTPKRKRKDFVSYLTPNQLEEFMVGVDDKLDTIHGVRFKALLVTLLETGMRITEALSLNKDSINRKTRRAHVTGKGDKQSIVIFGEWSLYWVDQYLKLRADDNPALFVNHAYNGDSERLNSDHVRRHFQNMSKYTGVKATPHEIRRTAATWFKRNGGDIRDVQLFLRHSKITTTELYVGKDWDAMQRSKEQYLDYGKLSDIGTRVKVTKQWSRKSEACKGCNETSKKHLAKGFCVGCYWKIFEAKKQEVHTQPLEFIKN